MRTAVFPGTFNPFTRGHQSIVDRGLQLFDRIVIAIGVNVEKADENTMADVASRVSDIEKLYAGDKRVEVISYSCLTATVAEKFGARFLLRGVRSVADYEYERNMADINRRLFGIETVLLFAEPELSMVSSSIVRELETYGIDPTPFLPK